MHDHANINRCRNHISSLKWHIIEAVPCHCLLFVFKSNCKIKGMFAYLSFEPIDFTFIDILGDGSGHSCGIEDIQSLLNHQNENNYNHKPVCQQHESILVKNHSVAYCTHAF